VEPREKKSGREAARGHEKWATENYLTYMCFGMAESLKKNDGKMLPLGW
jgi:hypothetical protein